MTASRAQKNWPYLLLVAVWLIVFPIIAGIIVAVLQIPYRPAYNQSIDFNYVYIIWGTILFYATWSFLLFLLLPYSLTYIYTSLRLKNIIWQFIYFFGLLVVMGFIVPYGSVIGMFLSDAYPRALVLYFFLTIMLCPLCNIALNRIVRSRTLAGKS
ncbi:hypothetical protein C1N53_13460 [Pontibacter sp. SGAir0037]|nr:hypothetical protein C1N53_13460 [Pontibacter sp. SGAir0037]